MQRTGHAKPSTRREFLASGLLSASGAMLLPSALTMLANSGIANAAESYTCPTGEAAAAATRKPGLMSMHLSGGAGNKGMFVGTDKGGGLVNGNTMNLGNVPNVTRQFGANFASDHPFTNPFRTELALSGITDAQVRIAPVIALSNNDNSNDRLGVQFMASLAGIQGQILPALGFNSAPYLTPVGQVPPRELFVTTLTQVQNAAVITGALSQLSQASQASVIRTVSSLSMDQISSLQSGGVSQLRQLLYCSGVRNLEVNASAGSSTIDPRLDATFGAQISAVWGFNAATPANNRDLVAATLLYNTLQGNAGMSIYSTGGNDYHQNALATTDAKDLDNWRVIAKLIRTCAVMNRKCFFAITSDGSVRGNGSATRAGSMWQNDDSNSMQLMVFFDPTATAANPLRLLKGQLGAWTTNQTVDATAGGPPSESATAVALMRGYLDFAKASESEIQRISSAPIGFKVI